MKPQVPSAIEKGANERMTGRLHIRNGQYVIILNLKDEATGKYKTKWISTGFPEKGNKRRAEQLLNETIAKYANAPQETPENPEPQGMTMAELIREWLEVKKITVRATSYEAYRITAESQVIPYFEKLGVPVNELTAAHIQRYFTDKIAAGFMPSTMPKHHTVIHSALEYAVGTLGIISANPADRVKLPARKKRIPAFYSEEQLKKLFKESEGSPIEMVIRLSATYGLRRSEVLGLKWSAVDWKQKTIVIRHTVVRVGSKTVRDDTVKEAASCRTMPLTSDMEDYLKRLYAHQRQMKQICKGGYIENDYICKWDNGAPFDPNYITRKFRQILEKKGLSKIRFHDLRHSSASLLINMGFTLKEVQEWLGHADIASTEIYSHLLYKSKETMADRINQALSTNDKAEADDQAVSDS